jgi:putative membrane protein
MPALFAFLHHVAAFALVAALAVELVLLRTEVTPAMARRLQRTDMIYGAAAGVVVVVGLLRVFYFEKGAPYYFHNGAFLAKLSLFVLVGLVSIYPTIEIARWARSVRRGDTPAIRPARLRTMRHIVHAELAAVVAILLCAALMARGIGQL